MQQDIEESLYSYKHELEQPYAGSIEFEGVLQNIFDDPSTKLDFNIENFRFTIHQDGREPFDFNSLSSGYSAIFAILNYLMMRTVKPSLNTEGIVIIDDIETHLHLALQRTIMPTLTHMFPNLQFIISTHFPFVLSSIDNAVIFDLENKILVKQGFVNFPYESIVEGYFCIDSLSKSFIAKFERYKSLFSQSTLTDEDYAEIMELEVALDALPDFIAVEFTAE